MRREYLLSIIQVAGAINQTATHGKSLDTLADALQAAAKAGKNSALIMSADGAAPHQAVVTVTEAARRVGLRQITFAAQSFSSASARAH